MLRSTSDPLRKFSRVLRARHASLNITHPNEMSYEAPPRWRGPHGLEQRAIGIGSSAPDRVCAVHDKGMAHVPYTAPCGSTGRGAGGETDY